ncbi:MAG: hypothetical protein H0W33_12945 [Gammaproteobacteria bacterium]|nr:hypothetical protein [Gammaproteobacteria bacterium]
MTRRIMSLAAWTVCCVLLPSPHSHATTVLELNLVQMTDRAEKIFRGTVLSVDESRVEAGGGELPALIYRIQVDETFKGEFAATGVKHIVELKVLGSLKQYHSNKPIIPDFPLLRIDSDYLLLMGAAGATGLSAPAGLSQGAFLIYVDAVSKDEVAVNGNDNANVFKGMNVRSGPGPVSYQVLSDAIHAQLGY